jgi:hypothetical protein
LRRFSLAEEELEGSVREVVDADDAAVGLAADGAQQEAAAFALLDTTAWAAE